MNVLVSMRVVPEASNPPPLHDPFNPFDASQSRDAWERLRAMRAEGAVVEIANGMRYVTRYAEARAVLRDTTRFSNAAGMKAPGVVIPPEDRLLGELDPPRHTAVRRVMVTALTPKVVHAAEPFTRDTAAALLRDLPAGGCDLVTTYTTVLPNRVTVYLLGFDPADADQLAAWAKGLMESTFPALNRTERGDGFAGAFPEFAGYIDARIAECAEQLGAGVERDDVLARLLRLEVEDEPLPPVQLRALVRNLITGGLTTTSQLLGNLLHEMLTHPDLDAALRADPAAVATAIEESLRLHPPILFLARGITEDTEVAQCPLHAGGRLVIGAASANRDEREFDDPDAFRIDRENADRHLTFGYGPHVCPGATLARVVTRIALDAFWARFEPGTIALEPGFRFEQVPTYFEHGPRSLPVRY